jgi:hypothetical protein
VRTTCLLFLIGFAFIGFPKALSGQEGAFAFQLRGGAFLPTGDLRSEKGWEKEAKGDVAFGMGFTFPLVGPLGTYFGFSQYRFSCDPSVCPEGEGWESTGFDVALRLVVRRRHRIRPWLQVGLHTHRVRSRIYDPETVRERHSEGGGGIEVGGGILVQIRERMSLSPGLRYGHAEAPYDNSPDLRLRYLVADLGLVVGF